MIVNILKEHDDDDNEEEKVKEEREQERDYGLIAAKLSKGDCGSIAKQIITQRRFWVNYNTNYYPKEIVGH